MGLIWYRKWQDPSVLGSEQHREDPGAAVLRRGVDAVPNHPARPTTATAAPHVAATAPTMPLAREWERERDRDGGRGEKK
jgi:hypothetical protein